MTSNTFHDCDHMFFSEFKQLVDYAIEKYNSLYARDDAEASTELDMMPHLN